MTDSVKLSLPLGFYSAWRFIMNMHFEYSPKEKAPLGQLVEMCDVALALIHERGQLLKLLRANPAGKDRNNIFTGTLKRLKNLERVSHQVQLAFRNPVGDVIFPQKKWTGLTSMAFGTNDVGLSHVPGKVSSSADSSSPRN
jgi:hypothetical protein